MSDALDRLRHVLRESVAPRVAAYDDDGVLPLDVVRAVADVGGFGHALPASVGGQALSARELGHAHALLGATCASLRAVLTVHAMTSAAIARWGSAALRDAWLPCLARGERTAAFALTEPGAGADPSALATKAAHAAGGIVLNGQKSWVTNGQRADVFLVFARLDAEPVAVLVARGTPGLSITPIAPPLGLRAGMHAALRFDACVVPESAVIGRPGAGLSWVAQHALDLGRFLVAWGCVGLTGACLRLAQDHARARRSGDGVLFDHALVRQRLARMASGFEGSRLICEEAARLRDEGHPHAIGQTLLAKYHASLAASEASASAVQLLGAAGTAHLADAQRHFRDAKIMEIIEGPTPLLESELAAHLAIWSEP